MNTINMKLKWETGIKRHDYLSLSCSTAISTKCNEFSSSKRVYVKYNTATLSNKDFFSHMKILDTWTYACPEISYYGEIVTQSRWKQLNVWKNTGLNVESLQGTSLFLTKQHILIFYINAFQRKSFTKFQRKYLFLF